MTSHPDIPMTKPSPEQPDKPDREVEVINPRYKGATPAMVMRALIRNLNPPPSEEEK